MTIKRKKYTADERARIALEALSGCYTLNELTSKYGVHGTQINGWRKRLKSEIASIFQDRRGREKTDTQALIDELYKEIGRLKMELEWLKKNQSYSIKQKRQCIDLAHTGLSVSRQCELLELPRRSYYYHPNTSDEYNLFLMRQIDEEYTRHPFVGTCRMVAYLKSLGLTVNRKRIQNLYRLTGIKAVYAKPKTSQPNTAHKIYPYLLRNTIITGPNHVWSTDLTYVRMCQRFMYLMAIIDWYTRFVLGWALSPTLEADFCVELLDKVISKNCCKIFNTDQGSQFTSSAFTSVLLKNNIRISMDGKGRALDNAFIERLWRSVKYECIYLNEFESVIELECALKSYFDYYNYQRHPSHCFITHLQWCMNQASTLQAQIIKFV